MLARDGRSQQCACRHDGIIRHLSAFQQNAFATHPDMVTSELTTEANSDNFIHYVSERILEHINSNNGYKHPYVFIHGIGKIFPYLRTNVFLTKYEKYNDTDKYKIILFYPGHQEGNSFSLFDTLEDAHTYRATLLVNK
jgi:hypothetical protein